MSKVKVLIHKSVRIEDELQLDGIVRDLQLQREYLHNLPIEQIIEFFDSVIASWNNSKNGVGLFKNLSDFFCKENLTKNMKSGLRGDIDVLDRFSDIDGSQYLVHAQPRGLSVHWLAGNVAILGIFSIFCAILTKNVCLVKASSRGYQELVKMLMSLTEISTNNIKGKDILDCISVILVDRTDNEAQIQISQAADVRIAWGGNEAIETITSLPKKFYCEDIIFGPKYSFALIDQSSLQKDFKKIAQRLAIDASVFDQYACSSPHTVFVQENDSISAVQFAEELARQMELVQRTLIPKGKTDPSKAMEIVSLRAEYSLKSSKVFQSKGTEWTVIYDETPGMFEGCFSRVIVVKKITELIDIKQYITRQMQTLGIALEKENNLRILDELTLLGVDRCPDLGTMTFFEPIWDGMFIFDRLVRWISVNK